MSLYLPIFSQCADWIGLRFSALCLFLLGCFHSGKKLHVCLMPCCIAFLVMDLKFGDGSLTLHYLPVFLQSMCTTRRGACILVICAGWIWISALSAHWVRVSAPCADWVRIPALMIGWMPSQVTTSAHVPFESNPERRTKAGFARISGRLRIRQ